MTSPSYGSIPHGVAMFSLFLFIIFTIPTAFGGECRKTIRVPLARDTTHTAYRTHGHDVAAYVAENRFGLRDYAPLIVDGGAGTWCYSFGSLRPFGIVMGTTGIVVTVNGQTTIHSNVNFNEFWVTGLEPGDLVQIEFMQPFPYAMDKCERRINTSMTTILADGRTIPNAYYTCAVNEIMWRVVELKQLTTDPADHVDD